MKKLMRKEIDGFKSKYCSHKIEAEE